MTEPSTGGVAYTLDTEVSMYGVVDDVPVGGLGNI